MITETITADQQVVDFSTKLKNLDSVADTLPDMIAVFELESRHMVYSNQYSFAAHGYDYKKFRQMDAKERSKSYIHPDDHHGYDTFFETLKKLDAAGVATYEYRAKNENDEWHWFQARGKVFHRDENGEATHCLNIVQNTTQRKLTEQAVIEKNQELQAKNDELEAFAFIASHDLKEPLRKINTFSSWLVDKESETLSDQGKMYLKRMQNSVTRMNLLINDILVLLRLEDRQKELEIVDMELLLKRVVEDLESTIQESGAELQIGSIPPVKGYASSIPYLFTNLLTNAIKFRKPDVQPIIKIAANIISGVNTGFYNADLKKKYLEIVFTDNGIGFEEQYSKIIFQMFQRLHGKSEYPGTGIGLAICKKVMDIHEGFIKAHSTPGQGASFSCYFPVI